ncbi:adenosylcobinamide-GDP ribazoletransferase [uncultured Desulfovibrio sp.]|uniref:Adenosylcobinamide-GDP ribazoletransferase n=1 Tax=Candidatus Desulfovibrio intestinavium TaxID=2838534 RepID=A0A9D2KSL7_9BACT|nr:adenosylcobinamide-GDP ribazoletransferase [uncultured Desulfovibrio sp.]HJA80025.1 adenosylcobinamide-GDP ribazoletransferase [Candidatus Desulfovibrio intestinavium]
MSLRAAIAFFTRLPVGAPPAHASFHGIVGWLPVVGILVGAGVAVVLWCAAHFLPPAVCGLLGCLVWVGLTGGLHLDGVADCADGLLVEAPPARRLEIMKDSRLGTFGALGLFFVLGGKTLALGALVSPAGASGAELLPLLALCGMAAVTARSAVLLALLLPCARPGGLGSAMNTGITTRNRLWAVLLALVFCLANGTRGLLALVVALLVVAFLLRAARRRIGGVTGDVFGCVVEVTECGMLLAVC